MHLAECHSIRNRDEGERLILHCRNCVTFSVLRRNLRLHLEAARLIQDYSAVSLEG